MPGVLKAKVDGTWVPIVGPGQGVPAGGVAGDIMIKTSVNPYATRWGTDVPKLTVGGGSDQWQNVLQVVDSTHATSRRAAIALGSGWGVGQDLNANGTKDLYIYNVTNTRESIRIDTTGRVFSFGDGGAQTDIYLAGIQTTGNLATSPRVSSNGAWLDMHAKTDAYVDGDNIYFRTAAYGAKVTMSSNGFVYFNGTNSRIADNGEFRIIAGGTTMTFQADNFQVLNTAGSAWKFRHNGSTFECWGNMYAYNDVIVTYNITSSTIYCSNWLRARGDTGLYLEDRAVGWNAPTANVMSLYGGYGISINSGQYFRFYAATDGNHLLQYQGSTPSGSGEASNGPMLQGYGTVWLHTMLNKNLFLASGGSIFINAGNSYLTFSSREMKHNIKPLDAERALLMIKQWRPVEYDWNEDLDTPHQRGFGFIAEDHVEVLPEMCHTQQPGWDGPESERCVVHRPGWTNAIDYPAAVPWLTGAVQALLMRVEDLESQLAERN